MNGELLLFANSVERHAKEINGNVQPTGKRVEIDYFMYNPFLFNCFKFHFKSISISF